jgi:hypothetical protein
MNTENTMGVQGEIDIEVDLIEGIGINLEIGIEGVEEIDQDQEDDKCFHFFF